MPMFDVLIAGGGPAGLNAALVLGRQRRRVLLCDDGHPRNAGVRALHGFLSRDGIDPAELRRLAREEIRHYGTVELRDERIETLHSGFSNEGFIARLANGRQEGARRVLLATGLADDLPPIDGLASLWGRGIFHCRHCDGWEVRDQPIAIIARPHSDAQTLTILLTALLRLTTDIVLCTNGHAVDHSIQTFSQTRGITIRDEPIIRFRGGNHGLDAIDFDRGEPLARRAALLQTSRRQRSDLAGQLGCHLLEDGCVEVDDFGQSNVRGVFAAGDMARRRAMPIPEAQVILAAGSGVICAVALDISLLREDVGVHPSAARSHE
jgi:thioredoxin reductase